MSSRKSRQEKLFEIANLLCRRTSTIKCDVNVPVAFSVLLLQLVQAEKVNVCGRVWQPFQWVSLKAITHPGGA